MKLSTSALAAAMSALLCGTAFAQSETTPAPESTPQGELHAAPDSAAAMPVEQKKVEQFADAYVEVQTIQQKANTELSSTTDPAKADEVKASAQTDMIAAVERSGLQLDEFNSIVASMAADDALRSRVSAEVQKRLDAKTPSGT